MQTAEPRHFAGIGCALACIGKGKDGPKAARDSILDGARVLARGYGGKDNGRETSKAFTFFTLNYPAPL